MNRVAVRPEMLHWACERAGYDPSDLEHRFPQLPAWGRGEKRPTLNQFERNVSYFYPRQTSWLKRELDIALFRAGPIPLAALEFKYPRSGQYPEQMYKACIDIAFLEQLVSAGFSAG